MDSKIIRQVHSLALILIVAGGLFFINSNNPLKAQSVKYPKHQLGLGYSSFSASGLSYLLDINKYSSLQFNILPFYTGTNSDNLDITVLLGAEYHFTIARFTQSRIFLLAGTGYSHLESRVSESRIENDVIIIDKQIKIDNIINLGLGIGYEYKPHARISLGVSLGILHQESDNGIFSEFWDRNPSGTNFTGIGGGIYIRYNF
ncbi:MAG: hypothetical protein WC313_11325 [Candidatus Kapaibacterium sp.]|jgi:hypothetical protein|nr:hypothetical protein [Candidatus Kapabacteria bacterium]